jgi:hypothetical protein
MRLGTPIRRLCGATALAIALIAPSSSAAAGTPPRGFFGVVPSSLTPADVTRMAENGVATARVQVNWGWVERQPGQRNWSNYDSVVGVLAESGLQTEPVLLGVPSWISVRPAKPPIYTPAQRQAWTSFLSELAARYGHGGSFWSAHPELPYMPLRDWEVWNEPNLSGYWGGRPNPRQYVRLLRVTGAGLRRSDPQARIGIGGIFPPPRPRYGVSLQNFMQGIYRVRGARQAFDAVSIHPYASRPKGVLASTREARRIMNRHKDRATSLWITEVGWTTGGRHLRRSPYKATESQQAKFLRQTFRRLIRSRRALHLQLLIWHAWQDSALPGQPWTMFSGLIRSDGSAKPSLNAYSQIAARMG